MPDHYQNIYRDQAAAYDRLVRCEDSRGELTMALQALATGFPAARAVEFGAGTGRCTAMIAPHCERIDAYDAAPAMIDVARVRLASFPQAHCHVAAHLDVAFPPRTADFALAGWTFGHHVGWHPESWREAIGACLDRFESCVRPGGLAIIIETLGSGQTRPVAPNQGLADYYHWLEARGYRRTTLRTDYCFDTVAEAVQSIGAFFGPVHAQAVQAAGSREVPECTGLWSLTVAEGGR